MFFSTPKKEMVYTFSSYQTLQNGDTAPDFSLPDADGKPHSLAEYAGAKALLIVFMCNHCPYVQPKIQKLVDLYTTYKKQGLQIVGINANDITQFPEDAPGEMKTFATERGMAFDYLYDESQEVPKKYGAVCTPDPFLFDAKQTLAYHGRIDDAHGKPSEEATTNELEEAIQRVLKAEPLTVQTLPSAGCNIKWKN